MRDIKFKFWNKKLRKMSNVLGLGVIYEYLCEEWGVFDWKDIEKRQFTGILDKNGVDVYEGDIIDANIIEHSISTMGQVVFCEEYSTYANRNLAGDTFLWKLNRIKVRGNIFESPELLK